jgi:uncharacterized protein (DUF427 family)
MKSVLEILLEQSLYENIDSGYDRWLREFFADFDKSRDMKSLLKTKCLTMLNSIEQGFNAESFVEQFLSEYDIDERDVYYFDDIDDDYLEEFKAHVRREIKSAATNIYVGIKHNINNNMLYIYRSMSVSDNYIEQLAAFGKHLGIYWTYDEDSARPYWSRDGEPEHADNKMIGVNEITIISAVNENYIDWNRTFDANIQFDFGYYFDEDYSSSTTFLPEHEVVLFKGTPMKISNILNIYGEVKDTTIIKDKIFYA